MNYSQKDPFVQKTLQQLLNYNYIIICMNSPINESTKNCKALLFVSMPVYLMIAFPCLLSVLIGIKFPTVLGMVRGTAHSYDDVIAQGNPQKLRRSKHCTANATAAAILLRYVRSINNLHTNRFFSSQNVPSSCVRHALLDECIGLLCVW